MGQEDLWTRQLETLLLCAYCNAFDTQIGERVATKEVDEVVLHPARYIGSMHCRLC